MTIYAQFDFLRGGDIMHDVTDAVSLLDKSCLQMFYWFNFGVNA